MGLFGRSKEIALPKVSDLFSVGALEFVTTTVAPKVANGEYGVKYGDVAKTLLNAVKTPDKELTKRELNGVIFSAGAMTKIEPKLAPVLNEAIARFKAFKKQK
ncbi:MAG: hypothetical protein J5441_03625 [Clostridia bacterium]|nr:hypothetical protein [Clostridia bacterium]